MNPPLESEHTHTEAIINVYRELNLIKYPLVNVKFNLKLIFLLQTNIMKAEIIQRKNSHKKSETKKKFQSSEKEAEILMQKSQSFWIRYKKWILTLITLLSIQFMFGFFLGSNPVNNIVGPIITSSDKCNLHKDAKSAIKRAKSEECREKLEELACLNVEDKLYAKSLPKLCPVKIDDKVKGHYLGCFQDSFAGRILNDISVKKYNDNGKETCLKECQDSAFMYSGLQYGKECFCGNKRPDEDKLLDESKCNMTCPGDEKQFCGGYLTMNVYQTGYIPQKTVKDINDKGHDNGEKVRNSKYVHRSDL